MPSHIHVGECVAQAIGQEALWWTSCKDIDKGPIEH